MKILRCEFCKKKIDTKNEFLELSHFEKLDKIKMVNKKPLVNYFHVGCLRDQFQKRCNELVQNQMGGLLQRANHLMGIAEEKIGS